MQDIVFEGNIDLYKKYSNCHSCFYRGRWKIAVVVAHNFIHRKCAQLFGGIDCIRQGKWVVQNVSLR
jgi:hypothetical protein